MKNQINPGQGHLLLNWFLRWSLVITWRFDSYLELFGLVPQSTTQDFMLD